MRIVISLLIATIITFALFVFMASLISGGAKRAALKQGISPTIIISMELKDSETQFKHRQKLPPPKPLKSPSRPEIEVPAVTIDPISSPTIIAMSNDLGRDISHRLGGLKADTYYHGNSHATPLVRIEPRYPIPAAREKIQGWVQLGFSIDIDGSVSDIFVVAAEPQGVFEQAAISALQKWRYQPEYSDGKAIKQKGKVVQLDFRLSSRW
ncbi:energy transducer TonB [Paraferrimonas haliotis]|uniref:energy transducer TonB n=1 Tax=Paraferrimonas haliotis TaxID=2013866 RepID=UPI000BA8E1F3|nr:energy transducer TonB [Paraferrimonas haliotis]